MRIKAALFCALLAASLCGCATSYGTEGLTGGYSEKELEPGIWRVAFGGNGYTSYETVQTYWLYRCAELALAQGYDGFQIISNVSLVSYDPQSQDAAHLVLVHGGGGGGTFVYVGGVGVAKPALQADIRLLHSPFTPKPPKIFNAAALKATLEPLVKGQLCGGNVCAHVHHYLMDESSAPPPPPRPVPPVKS